MRECALDRFATWLLRCSLRFASPEQRSWAEAMLAELPQVESGGARLRWSAGCAVVLFRQWLAAGLTGSRRLLGGPMMTRPMFGVLLTLAVLMVGLLCLPEFREALAVERALAGNIVRENGRSLSNRRLAHLVARAEREKNPRLLVYAALRSSEPRSFEYARRAVERDPSLTWVYGVLCSELLASRSAGCGEMTKQLIAWDGDNAIPYLLLASWRKQILDPEIRTPVIAPNDPQWSDAMIHVFAARRYDTYQERSTNLLQSIYEKEHEGSIAEYVDGLVMIHPIPSLSELTAYTRATNDKNPQSIIEFSRLLITNGHSDLERSFAGALLLKAYERVNQLKPGTVPSIQVAAEKQMLAIPLRRDDSFLPLLFSLAITFQGIAVAQMLFALSLSGFLLTCGVQRLRKREVGHWLQTLVVLLAGGLGLTSVAMLLVYHPYAKLPSSFFARTSETTSPSSWAFFSLYHWPAFTPGPTPMAWAILLILCGIAHASVLAKAIQERMQSRTTE
jgi:hypothetical protein